MGILERAALLRAARDDLIERNGREVRSRHGVGSYLVPGGVVSTCMPGCISALNCERGRGQRFGHNNAAL